MPSHLLHKKFTVSAAQYGISPKDFPKNALSIVDKLHLAGFEAYIVGGCIRDLLLEKNQKILILPPMLARKKFNVFSADNAA